MMTGNEKIDLIGIGREELCRMLSDFGMKPFRGKQLFQWIHKNGETSFDRMTDFSKRDREILNQRTRILLPALTEQMHASDGTEKFLYRLADGHTIEGVLIPDRKRLTLCVSTQAGCAMGCAFCLTGQGGLVRHLTASEIVGQVLLVRKILQEKQRLTHIVLMGMGEPLANYENTIQAVRILLDPMGADFSKRKITLSTCGLIPGIKRLAAEKLGIHLAVSLNASDSLSRGRIMPVNRTYPMEELLDVLRNYPLPVRNRITFEYVLIHGINDSLDDATRLTRILRGIRCKINLIPYNPVQGLDFASPPKRRIEAFQDILQQNRYTAVIRESRGREISAACGQLRERERAGL
ncbi:MAG: 23S rRNA (adenine(2503)-C(2))-methyltransferase RlmN [Nitrospirae bacterium CG_4_9_14_3_um_filter_53_35]|nr:MAG: 23S rRNA (adenine(2503)-C(2))-methyltransferase RlmN [Nitrospirae bacterium CG08_land_8_20_14_0_20_52_24]PIX86205.1 MAG: 23S rRNA (adenine(2503)-C(2))-methyltransferase RlmN [Nitrospirae bacterium CG_4_10_14_3_um_filter_53_41]PJA74792.1 MAG: 23S rRNA (adenine(2503)-C(2))-methyltransferase RlmN [Nitrospirae bacterium CG_4_9_14_3_um_filter_53_35]